MIKEDILARKNLADVKGKLLVAKDEFNYILILPRVCGVLKGKG